MIRINYRIIIIIFMAILISLLLRNSTDKEVSKIDNEYILLWWTPFLGDIEYTQKCKRNQCFITGNRSYLEHENVKALLFYGSNLNVTDLPLPRSPQRIWSLFHEESPKNVPFLMYTSALELFNLTATFSQYSDFPITLQYLNENDIMSTRFMISIEMKNHLIKNEGLAPIIFLQSICSTMSGRNEYISELMKYIKIDSYGKCLKNRQDLPIHLAGNDYLASIESEDLYKFIGRYKFIIAYENGICNDYITEKLWRSFSVGVIPIYFGAPNIEEWLPDNKSAILIKDFESPELLANYILKINTNDTEYLKYFDYKSKISNKKLLNNLQTRQYSVDNVIEKYECFVCDHQNVDNKKIMANKLHYNCNEKIIYPKMNKNNEFNNNIILQGKCPADLFNLIVRNNKTLTQNRYFIELDKLYNTGNCDT